ncbi:MAG: SDR family NAD(P)-dependent oxidoreductase [Oligoflexia bacterium]|nr:SDR family NAD(P)-dependent oxidoreductase [Oligoflexia bacterium]
MKTTVVDFDYPVTKPGFLLSPVTFINKLKRKGNVKRLEQELLVPSENEIIAYRKGRRFVKQYEHTCLTSSSVNMLQKGGVYLIAGGLGKKGKQIAHFLVKNYQARLIIVDRKQLPDKKDWNEYLPGSEKEQSTVNDIEVLRELESHGREILFYSADIADAEQMRILLEDAQKQIGSVYGVIHAASMDTSDPIITLNNNKIEECLAAKVTGTLVLDQLFHESKLDFFVLFSSGDTATAEHGKAAVMAAGAFMNAYTENRITDRKRKTICLDWGIWNFEDDKKKTVMDDDSGYSDNILSENERFSKYISKQGIKPDEAFHVFKKSLSEQSGSLVISPVDLPAFTSEIELRYSENAGHELVEPRDDIERTLADYWKEIIGIRHLGVRENFFDVGGHSLTAVRLFAKIKEKYDIQWPLAVLFEAPTIEECAVLIREEIKSKKQTKAKNGGNGFRFLVKMNDGPGNDAKPLYIAAGGFGNVLNLRHLAQLIGNDRPVYGLQAKGLLGDDLPHETFESAAADYLREIRKVQPNGPYILCGFCSGGEIAYEMAQQLTNNGETVSHVIMLDAIASDWRECLTRKDKIDFHMISLRKTGIKYPFLWFVSRVKWECKKLQEKLRLNKEQTGPAVFRGRAIFDATLRAEDRYKPKKYNGKVTLFRPKLDQFVHLDGGRIINKKREFVRPDNGWSPHIKHLDIQEIAVEPGDHDGFVLEPAVRDLYFKLKTILTNN